MKKRKQMCTTLLYVIRFRVGNYKGCVIFEFNDISLYTENDSEWKQPVRIIIMNI